MKLRNTFKGKVSDNTGRRLLPTLTKLSYDKAKHTWTVA